VSKPFAAALAIAAVSTAAYAAPESYTVDPAHTYPNFEINHLGFSTMHGKFERTSGKIVIDPATKSGSIDVKIDTASVDTGHAKRDEHLRSDTFFNVAQFPTMNFKASKLRFEGDRLVGADGELTLLGKTLPVVLAVTNFHCGPNPIVKKPECGADATTSIKRSAFGMDAYVPAVGDEVKISIEVEAFKD